MQSETAWERFQGEFGREPTWVARAPGRVNLIGEHTDYSQGYVFPATIDREITVYARQSAGPFSRLISLSESEVVEFSTRDIAPGPLKNWGVYPAGMAWAMQAAGLGTMPEVDAIVDSTLPKGSGVSSSAALELAFGALYREMTGQKVTAVRLAQLAQLAENQFVGVACGIMDQMASALGREGHALFIDTRDLSTKVAPMPEDWCLVLCDTQTPRTLAGSAYNERRRECEQAATLCRVSSLRDLTEESLQEFAPKLEGTLFRRARHVTSENARCLQFFQALEADDRGSISALMKSSHLSLRDDYEVSSPALDTMAEAAWQAPGCIGARMTGAGFGGACIAIVEKDHQAEFLKETEAAYRAAGLSEPQFLVCETSAGASAHPGGM